MVLLYTLSGVERTFGEHCALSIPSLEIPAGGLTAVVGPNGAGKTTLLRLLAFVDSPTRGEIVLDGGERSQRILTLLDQNPFLFRGTVEFNVAYGPRARGLPRSERAERVRRALESVGAAHLSRQGVHRLSGGEKRRVALARALATPAEVLLLDEPFAELDREHIEKTERALRLRGEGGTVIFTAHDLAQAHRLADRVISLVGGRVSPVPLANLFRGEWIERGAMPIFRSSGIEFAVAENRVDATLAAIDPEAILVSAEPLRSSARNCFSGTIVQAESRGAFVYVTVDCGALLVAAVTRHSYEELGLNAGRAVWVTFKSTAVHLYSSAAAR